MWIQQIVFKNIDVYRNLYMFVLIINEKKVMILKMSWKGYIGGFGGLKGKGENIIIKL